MKVLIVTDIYAETNDGTTSPLIDYLFKSGDEVHILYSRQNRRRWVNYFRVKSESPFSNIEDDSLMVHNPPRDFLLKTLWGMDIVYISMPFPLGYRMVKLARDMSVPIVAGFHVKSKRVTPKVNLLNFSLANKGAYKTFYRKLFKFANAVHYPTEFTRRVFEGAVRRRTNGYIITNGVNDHYKKVEITREPALSNKFNILYIGRYSKEKGHNLLIKAVAGSKYKEKIQLVFIGEGEIKNYMISLCEKLGVNPPITKHVTRDELVKIINSCDLYVHPARQDIEALSCLKAIACGLVPVISDSISGSTKEFALNEHNLFKHNSIEDLTVKIDYWIEHPEEKEQCSEQYLSFAKTYSEEKCMQEMREMLEIYADPVNHNKKVKHYYRDILNDDFALSKIEVKKYDKPFKYVHKNPIWNFFALFAYHVIARPVSWIIAKVIFHQRIRNASVLKKCKGQGYFIYANHTQGLADALTPNLLSLKRNYTVTSRETISIPGIKGLVSMLGAIPVYGSIEELKLFSDCISTRIKEGKSVTIYPEAHIWPYYTKIRPFKKDSFRFPVDLKAPVYIVVNTWQKRRITKLPKLVSYLAGPFYPNEDLPRNEAMEDLRNRVYEEMVKITRRVRQVEKIEYIKVDK